MKLTDAEREAVLHAAVLRRDTDFGICDRTLSAVECIVAARLEQQREAIAAAIEAESFTWGHGTRGEAGVLAALRIVREYQPREGP